MMPVSSASSPVDTAGSIATTIRTKSGIFRWTGQRVSSIGVERIAVVADRGYFKIEDNRGLRAGRDRSLRAASPAWVPRSERAYFAKMSSAMTRPVTAFSAEMLGVRGDLRVAHRRPVDEDRTGPTRVLPAKIEHAGPMHAPSGPSARRWRACAAEGWAIS